MSIAEDTQRNLEKLYSNVPLAMEQPFNLVSIFSLFSPIIVITFITSLSFISQNFKGLVYLGFILGASILRYYIYYIFGAQRNQRRGPADVCNSVQFTPYGNVTYSSFVFAFTAMYLFLPMFMNDSANYWLFSSTIFYFFFDMVYKIYKHCYIGWSDLLLNILCGSAGAGLIVMLMYLGNSSQFLFFNEIQSGKETCSTPKNQQFKCSVYKNGELLGDM
jgi:hypothetical protein